MDINAVNPLTESAELARTHKHTHTQLVETHARVYRRGRKLCAGMGGFADACMDGCVDACMDVRMHVWMYGCVYGWMQLRRSAPRCRSTWLRRLIRIYCLHY
eukprot:GHVU01154737.1.p1 GENE.GHVU01154737.1~~GHVU01154737.1.p1  ORF type:complete len:102 (-),score=1.45 GHVU01154737.1:496-801(-)